MNAVKKLCEDVGNVDGLLGAIFRAAETERKMPGVMRKRYKVAWPDYPSEWSAYGYSDAEVRLGPASAGEVSEYDRVIEALLLLGEDARLVWAVGVSAARRARGPAWTQLGKMLGMHPRTVKRRFERSLLELWYKINAVAKKKCL